VRGYESIKVLSENNPGKILENPFSDFGITVGSLIFVGLTMMVKFSYRNYLGSVETGNFAPSICGFPILVMLPRKVINLTGLTQLPVNFTMVGMAGF
jgi:CIC family chloride channel protein